VRTEILGGIVFAIHIVNSELVAIRKFNSDTSAGLQITSYADNESFAVARW
jgi:hypothetical protein